MFVVYSNYHHGYFVESTPQLYRDKINHASICPHCTTNINIRVIVMSVIGINKAGNCFEEGATILRTLQLMKLKRVA